MYGKKYKRIKKKMSISRLGRSLSEATKSKISKSLKEKYRDSVHFNYGRKHSEESKLNISKSRMGRNNPNWGNGEKIRGERNPMYGKTHSDESKAKMKLAAQNRKINKICFKCGESFIAKVYNAKYCCKCRKKILSK